MNYASIYFQKKEGSYLLKVFQFHKILFNSKTKVKISSFFILVLRDNERLYINFRKKI